jgi:type IV secretion system protein VirB10
VPKQNGAAIEQEGSESLSTIHLSLQGKGGVGKSLVASFLAQYLLQKEKPVRCIDTDPVNKTLSQYRGLQTEQLKLLREGGIDQRAFDGLMQQLLTSDGEVFVVDNGASIRTSTSPIQNPVLNLGGRPGADDLAQVAAIAQAVTGRGRDGSAPGINGISRDTDNEYDGQNMQARKESFLVSAQKHQTDEYLRSTRDVPLSMFEVKAGWEIPAVLEQNLNSDLPGELKALITASVYDTATGRYLLIPQGSRLVGKYDSRVAYGQDGVQVAWSRIIFPDASSIDLDGMVGLDSHGNAGLRDKVDRHYARIVGFSALTSLFSAAFAISQRQNQSVLAYPSPAETASSSVSRELSQTGSQITRRNLNVQPTVRVPVGYKFTVRVNRDILFETPYEPFQPNVLGIDVPGQLHQRTAIPKESRP